MKLKTITKMMVWIVMGFAVGCTDYKQYKNDAELEKINLPQSSKENVGSQQRFDDENFPNEKTQTVNITTDHPDVDQLFIKSLKEELLKDHFKLTKSPEHQDWSTNDCRSNKIIRITGLGVDTYYAERSVGIGERNEYYPDFYMTVMRFNMEHEAEQYFKVLSSAVNEGMFCNGKAPEKIIKNGHTIFYFATRAEMFRDYINQYAEFVEQYKSKKE